MGEDCEGERWMWWSGSVGGFGCLYLLGRECESEEREKGLVGDVH